MADVIGEITVLYGKAFAEGPDGTRELATGSPIHNGETISTGGEGSLEIKFTDGALLSQGPGATVHLDDYVFDPDANAGEMTMNLVEGTFRSVTGQIVDMNPEGFKIDTPMATIGIRGTTTGHVISPGGVEQHVVLNFDNKPVLIQPFGGGPVSIITQSGMGLTAGPSGFGPVGQMPPTLVSNLQQLSPEALQQGPPRFQDVPEDEQGEDGQEGDGEGAEGDDLPQGEGEGDGQGEGEGELEGQGEGEGELEGFPGLGPVGGEPPLGLPLVPTFAPPPPIIGGGLNPPPPVVVPTNDPDIDTEIVQTVVNNTLDLSANETSMTVNLDDYGEAYYEVTGNDDPEARVSIASNIVNVVGSGTEANYITGDDRDNQLTGGLSDDEINGDSGNDTIVGTSGNDVLNGGDDFDYISYQLQHGAVNVSLAGGSTTKMAGGTDSISEFEGIYGSTFGDNITGDVDANGLYGDGGNDTIIGGGGLDTLDGGEGDDVFQFDATAITLGTTVSGGAGTDAMEFSASLDATNFHGVTGIEKFHFTGLGSSVTVEARDFSDMVGGTGSATVTTVGTGSQETLTIKATNTSGEAISLANMTFDGATWEDTDKIVLVGETGNDTLTGSARNDSISAGAGEDTIYGGDGNDTIDGGSDDDLIYGNDGDDTLNGGDFADIIHGDAGADLIHGDAHNDILDGGEGDDTVWGDTGQDIIRGSAGIDVFKGGADADTLTYDHLDSASGHTGVNVNLKTGVVSNDGQGGSDTIYEFESLKTSDYDDTIAGASDSNSYIDAGCGNDEITNNGRQDTVMGGSGNDTLIITTSITASASHSFEGGAGTDVLRASGGDMGIDATKLALSNVEEIEIQDADTILMMDAATISGRALEITVDESTAEFQTFGSTGDDVVDFSSLTLNGTSKFSFQGDSGADTIRMGTKMSEYVQIKGNISDDLVPAIDALYYTDTDSADGNELARVSQMEKIVFGDANTKAFATAFTANYGLTLTVDGSGLSGSHTLYWDGSASDANHHVTGGCGDDTIIGANYDDTLEGSYGADEIFGGDGNDSILGGSGADILWGGTGNDTFVVSGDVASGTEFHGDGDLDQIYVQSSAHFGGSAAEEGIEEVKINVGQIATFDVGMSGFLSSLTTIYGSATNAVETIKLEGSSGSDMIELSSTPTFDASWGSEDVFKIFGYGEADQITAWNHATYIDGGSGADIIYGGSGADTILGGTEGDDITGGGGADIISGGAGDDTFVFTQGSDFGDSITDFETGDKLEFKGASLGIDDEALDVGWHFAQGDVGSITAADGLPLFIFDDTDPENTSLYFDADGNGVGTAVLVANLDDADLHATDIFVTDV